MNWEQKLVALNALTEISLKMRKPGDWYVSAVCLREVGGDGLLRVEYGSGASPEEAVEDDFRKLAEMLPSDRHVRVRGKKYRWNGFMWKEL